MRDVHMFTPGPTDVPLGMRLASVERSVHHRTSEFGALFDRIRSGLRELFGTSGDILVLPASGTGAMESAVANVVEPGDTVLVLAAGKYGRRWGELARTYRADVEVLDAPERGTFSAAEVEQRLRQRRPRHLFLTHCETSTGALHDVRTLAGLGRRYGATVVVDSMTTIGVEPFAMDEWGIDIAMTASHKALMSPPGAAFVAIGPQSWPRISSALGYSYWNYHSLRTEAERSTVPNTPPNASLLAVSAALDSIEEEGLDAVRRRHAACGQVCRVGLAALGFEVFTRATPANGLTAGRIPEGVRADGIVDELQHRFGFRIAGGQGALKGQIVRVGHIGSVLPLDLMPVLTGLELLVNERGATGAPGRAAAAMATVMVDHLARDMAA